MKYRTAAVRCLTVVLLLLNFMPGSAETRLFPVGREALCVTEGALQDTGRRLFVSVPKMRAYLNRWTEQTVAANIIYLGPTESETKLASGESRRQFGLKLRAQDACNLVYAMWRIDPLPELVVSVKSNPDQHSSSQCGNRGYQNIKPTHRGSVPALRSGDRHLLRAEMTGEQLRVSIDGTVVWDGNVGRAALDFDGPVGIRSDNAKVEFELQAGDMSRAHPSTAIPCRSGPGEAE